MFYKLLSDWKISKTKTFFHVGYFTEKEIKPIYDFAWGMTFGKSGAHRPYRSGGTHIRKNGELFINTFEGKLGELALYKEALKVGRSFPYPDLSMSKRGLWDSNDFNYKGSEISVKSVAYFSNLLLLETKDYTDKGVYLPNKKVYDYHVLVRIYPDCKRLMKKLSLFYSDSTSKEELWENISKIQWSYDIAGYINDTDLISIIKLDQIIPRGALLNGKTQMDAENYYVQSGDLKDIVNFFKSLP